MNRRDFLGTTAAAIVVPADDLRIAISKAIERLEASLFENSEHAQARAILQAALKEADDV